MPEGNLYTQESLQGIDTVFTVSRRYEWDEGLSQVPVAADSSGPGSTFPSEFVRLHAPAGKLVIEWVAERIGQEPYLPHPNTGDSNEVFLRSWIESRTPQLEADGNSPRYAVAGRYEYGLRVPLWAPAVGLPSSSAPYDLSTVSGNRIGPERFITGIIGAGGKPG